MKGLTLMSTDLNEWCISNSNRNTSFEVSWHVNWEMKWLKKQYLQEKTHLSHIITNIVFSCACIIHCFEDALEEKLIQLIGGRLQMVVSRTIMAFKSMY